MKVKEHASAYIFLYQLLMLKRINFPARYPFWEQLQTVQTLFNRRKTRSLIRSYAVILQYSMQNTVKMEKKIKEIPETPKQEMDSSRG